MSTAGSRHKAARTTTTAQSKRTSALDQRRNWKFEQQRAMQPRCLISSNNSIATEPSSSTAVVEKRAIETGYTFTAHCTPPTITSSKTNIDQFSMLVGSSATGYFVDSELLPVLEGLLHELYHSCWDASITRGKKGMLPTVLYDSEAVKREVPLPATIVPGLGHHLFFTGMARGRCNHYNLENTVHRNIIF